MLQNDASQNGTGQTAAPNARDDVDALPAGSMGPETGNAVTGAGTLTGTTGADSVGQAPATIVAVQGAGGTADGSAGSLQVDGQYGVLTIQADGSYSYVRGAGSPDGVQDVFTYTLADSAGARDTATLTIQIGRDMTVQSAELPLGTEGVVMLPAGVALSDIRVMGRDLVVTLPDGSEMVIPGGAVFVPQLVIGDVEVPPANVAALLVDSEPQPAAGTPESSGGNFEVDVPDLDPGVPLGDLIPPTELSFPQPDFEEPGQYLEPDEPPTVVIETPDNPAGATDATATVYEAGLPPREGEPAGSDSGSDGENTSGTIVYTTPDGFESVTVNGIPVTVGTVITTDYGVLTITGIDNGSNGSISYTYELLDNTSGDDTADVFQVTVTDDDGDTATATLTVDIIDDVPTARADTDSVAAGDFGPVTGNVITDASPGDEGDGDDGADTVGADDASVTSVSGEGGSDSSFSDGVLVVNGQYGVLTIAADGSYSYVRNADSPGGVTDVFEYTITDGDGDTSTSTLTIDIGDATPQVGQNPTVLLDDDALPGGNPGGVGDDPDAVNLSGTLSGSGGDGALGFTLLTSGAPSGFTYVDGPDGSVLVQQDGVTVLTVTVDSDTGEYSVTQNAPIAHPAGGAENNVEFTIGYQVTDADGDTAQGSLTINVDDDTPVIGRADVAAPTLLVDETNLENDASGDFSSLFSVDYGADGAGSTSYALVVVDGSDSGLVDVATGEPILLFDNDGVVEGRVGGEEGAVAFTVSVSDSGVVTLDQERPLEHPDATDHDDAVSPIAGSIGLSVTAIDADGDPVSETVAIGGSLVFEDDGPAVTVDSDQPELVVDETVLGINASASFAGVFTPVFGTDGAGSVSYALGINAGATGLVDTATGEAVVLVVNDGVIEGRTESGGELVFTVSVDAEGNVTLDQIRAVVHEDASDHDDAATLSADDLVTLTATVTDADGDTASATANIGQNLVFEDDGPDIDLSGENAPTLTVDESNLSEDSSASFADAFTAAFGADGAGSIDYALAIENGADSGLVDVATGEPILLFDNGGVIEGRVGGAAGAVAFTVSVSGSGVVTLDQLRAVEHPDATDPDDAVSITEGAISLTGTITDGDGDTDTASLDIGGNLVFEDDGPSVDASVNGQAHVVVDESAPVSDAAIDTMDVVRGDDPDLSGGLAIGSGTTAGPVIDAGVAFGADGPADSGALTYSLTVTDADSGVTLTDGSPISLVQLANGVVVGVVQSGAFAGQAAFAVAIDPATGAVTVEQYLSLDHPVNPDPNDPLGLAAGSLGATVTATDADGDSVTSDAVDITGQIRFLDDGPTASDEPQQNVAEGGTVSGQFDFVGGADGASVTHVNGVELVFGEDGYSQEIAVDDGTIQVTADGDYIFTADDSGSGVTSGTFTVTDGDGDPVTADWSVNITDVNVPTAGTSDAVVDDEGLPGGIPGGPGDIDVPDTDGDNDESTFSGTLDFDFGGDGAGSVGFGGMDGETATIGTETVEYSWAGNTLTATITSGDRSGTDLFEVTVDPATGEYELTLLQNVLHSDDGTNTENEASASLDFTVVDADGSTATGTLDITFDDDVPTATTTQVEGIVDEDGLPGGIAGGTGDVPGTATVAVGSVAALFSAGADAPLSFSLLTDTSALPALTSGGVALTYAVDGDTLTASAGGEPVFTFTLNDDGSYSFTLLEPLDHAPGGNENDLAIELGSLIQATDADGDSVTAAADGLVIIVDDDTPVAQVNGDASLPKIVLDETRPEGTDTSGGSAPSGDASATVSFAGNFGAVVQYGADGPGSVSYALNLSADGIGSGLYTLQPSDTTAADGDGIGQGVEITLSQDPDSGVITGSAEGTDYFTISIDSETGEVTFTQLEPIWHPTSGSSHDEAAVLNTDLASNLQVEQTVTDADGDTATATLDIGRGVFAIEDDGPLAVDDCNTLVIEIDNLGVDEILAQWTDIEMASGSVSNYDRDGDGLTDEIRWGTGTTQSGYGFVDNPVLEDQSVFTNEDFSLGTFTHYNHVIGEQGLESTTLSVNFTALINGQEVPVGPIEITFQHTETPNSGDPEASRDIISITSNTPTVTIDGVEYELQVMGFVDENGEIVTTVRTFEDQANSYELIVRFVQTDTVELSGNVLTNDSQGADDSIDVVAVSGFDGSSDDTADASGNYQVVGQYGVLTINSDGSYSYQLTANATEVPEGAQEQFDYVIEDADGDRSTATLTIKLDPDPAPLTSDVVARVDDDGLEGGNSAYDTGDLDANVGEAAPANPSEAIFNGAFGAVVGDGPAVYSLAGMDGESATVGTETVTYSWDSGTGTLTATGPRGILFTVEVDSATGSYTVELHDNVLHAPGGNENDAVVDIGYSVTDGDGDVSLGGLQIIFDDDGPTAVDDSATQAAENGNIIVDVLANDAEGADGVDPATGVAVIPDTLTGSGTLTYNGDGTFTYAPAANEEGTVSFDYQITDADGDTATATVTIDLQDDSTPVPADATAVVDDEGLPGGIPGGPDDIVVPNTDGDNNEATYSGTLTADFGNDAPGSFSFEAMDGETGTVGTETVEYSLSGNTLTATIVSGARAGTALFEVSLNPTTGSYSVALLTNVLHSYGGTDTENEATAALTFTASDSEGEGADGTLTITFDDDTPIGFVTEGSEVENGAGGSGGGSLDLGDGNIGNNVGADGGTVQFNPDLDGADSGLESGSQPIIYSLSDDGQTLTATADGETIFIVTLDQATSSYDVEMLGQIDSLTTIDFDDGGYDLTGGNTPWVGFLTPENDDSPDLLITPITNGQTSGTINSSDILFGVSSGNSVGSGEAIRIDFVTDLSGNASTAGGYNFDSHYTTNGASAFFAQTGGSTVRVTAYDDADGNTAVGDGTADPITGIVITYNGVSQLVTPTSTATNHSIGGQTFTVTLNPDGSVNVGGVIGASGAGGAGGDGTTIAVFTDDGYNSLEFAHAGGQTFKIGDFGAVVQSTDPVDFQLPVVIVDGDGDMVEGTPLDITAVAPGSTAAASMVVSQEPIADVTTKSLVSDSIEQQIKTMNAANSNTVFLGAVAAAGLVAAPAAASTATDFRTMDLVDSVDLPMIGSVTAGKTMVAERVSMLDNESREAVIESDTDSSAMGTQDSMSEGAKSVFGSDEGAPSQEPSQLSQGTEAPAQSQVSDMAPVADTVAMPSADALAAAFGGIAKGEDAGEAKGTAEVGRVLADALAGGEQGQSIDALLESLPSREAALEAADGPASHGAGAVPGWDMAPLAHFQSAHSPYSMESLALHQDAEVVATTAA